MSDHWGYARLSEFSLDEQEIVARGSGATPDGFVRTQQGAGSLPVLSTFVPEPNPMLVDTRARWRAGRPLPGAPCLVLADE